MTKTKLLLAGLLTGAVAFGTACKTETATMDRGTSANTPPQAPGDTAVGGSGESGDVQGRTRGEDTTTRLPEEEGTREMEPEVHQNPLGEPPGTGGSGLDPQPIDRTDPLGVDPHSIPVPQDAPPGAMPPGEGLK